MKQSSQAIVLLIASANAAATPTAVVAGYQQANAQWQSSLTAAGTSNAAATQSRTAPYALRNQGSLWSFPTPSLMKGMLAADYDSANNAKTYALTATTTAAGSTCMACIGGGAVWCSRTYGFIITSAVTYNADSTLTTFALGPVGTISASQGASWTNTAATDQGSCCNTQARFIELTGTYGSQPVLTNFTFAVGASSVLDSSLPAGNSGTPNSCVALTTTATGTGLTSAVANGTQAQFGIAAFEQTFDAYTSWWCSNGLYKTVTVATTTSELNIIQTLGQSDNQRQDLALVGCPMIAAKCGGSTVTGVTTLTSAQAVSTGAVTIGIPKTQSGVTGMSTLTWNDKCSWVATSLLYAPTFVMGSGTDAKGLATANWQIHHMEYTANQSSVTSYVASSGALIQTKADTNGAQQSNEALAFGNFIPKFGMKPDQFSTLRTWYSTSLGQSNTTAGVGSGNVSAYGFQSAQWFNPYSNGSPADAANQVYYAAMTTTQQYGNVSNMPYSTIAQNSGAAANLTALQNYGQNLTAYFDFRTVRYMPASSAQTVWASGNALNTSYTGATTAYATAKTTWNAYVAILKKNAKMDAFAAAFSPPKAPTVPPLPNMPWTPPTYNGYLKQTGLQNIIMNGNSVQTANFVSASQPTAQQFWSSLDAAQTIGGWGSFTAAVIQFRNGWGKSFGTIGYSPGAQTMSQIWNASAMCTDSTGTAAAGTVSTACDKSYTFTANATTLTGTAATNTVFTFVTVVSLWSVGNTETANGTTGTWAGNQSFQLVWTSGTWSTDLQNLSAITAPAAPTAADSLTGVAGASALAASSAAVLAIAALY